MGRPANITKDDTRRNIINAAEELFAYHGYSDTRIHAVADKVGVKKASVYYHFNGKTELYKAVIMGIVDDIEKRLVRAMKQNSEISVRGIKMLNSMIDFFGSNQYRAKILLRSICGEDEVAGFKLQAASRGLVKEAAGFIEQGIKEGVFRKINPYYLIQSITGMILFHFSSDEFGNLVIGDNIFSKKAKQKHKAELKDILLFGIIKENLK